MKRLVQNHEGVYMIDEDCLKRKEEKEREKEIRWQMEDRKGKEAKKGYK